MVKPKVFLDSSVLIAAILSPTGGSAYILSNFHSLVSFQINEYVFREVERILKSKFSSRLSLHNSFFLLLGVAGIEVVPNPSKQQVLKAFKWISQNDAPILASALLSSDYLLTLDNEFFGNKVMKLAQQKRRMLLIVKPREFIEKIREI